MYALVLSMCFASLMECNNFDVRVGDATELIRWQWTGTERWIEQQRRRRRRRNSGCRDAPTCPRTPPRLNSYRIVSLYYSMLISMHPIRRCPIDGREQRIRVARNTLHTTTTIELIILCEATWDLLMRLWWAETSKMRYRSIEMDAHSCVSKKKRRPRGGPSKTMQSQTVICMTAHAALIMPSQGQATLSPWTPCHPIARHRNQI